VRIAILAAGLLASLTARAEPALLRVAVVQADAPLGSEQKALTALEKQLAKGRPAGGLSFGVATAAEAALVAATPDALPEEWAGSATVVLLQVLPPRVSHGKRVSRGFGSLVVFRPPRVEPVYAERVEGELDTPRRAEDLGKWVSGAIGLGGRAGAP
jgi:hypothetical protein